MEGSKKIKASMTVAVVFLTERAPVGTAVALREAGYLVSSCHPRELGTHTLGIDWVIVVLDLAYPSAPSGLACLRTLTGSDDRRWWLAAVGAAEQVDNLTLSADEAVRVFARPLDVQQLLEWLRLMNCQASELLAGSSGASEDEEEPIPSGPSTVRPSMSRRSSSRAGSSDAQFGAIPAASESDLQFAAFAALAGLSRGDSIFPPGMGSSAGELDGTSLSPEIEALLVSSARRLHSAVPPSPDPAQRDRAIQVTPEVLAALDELLLPTDTEPPPEPPRLQPALTQHHLHPSSQVASSVPSTKMMDLPELEAHAANSIQQYPSVKPSSRVPSTRVIPAADGLALTNQLLVGRFRQSSTPPAAAARWPVSLDALPDTGLLSVAEVPAAEEPSLLPVTDPVEGLARAVRERMSGSLLLQSDDGQRARRVMLRDGDLVNAVSDVSAEALLFFLAERGDVSREVAVLRAQKLPHSGRRAAAALIANGYLGQDDLWPVLRAHAEWVVVRALRDRPARISLERDPPERLTAEPNVFGGAAGVEVFIEAVRRTVSPQDAARLLRIGGQFALGPQKSLLAESALEGEEVALAGAAAPSSVEDVLSRHARAAPLLLALVRLQILSLVGHGRRPRSAPAPGRPAALDPLDIEAVRLRIGARLALVQEADYFQLLGLDIDATVYDIRRAFVELRRHFEPSRLITPATADLSDDVTLIVEVLEEAYEILRDPHRRKRYRAALLATR